MCDNSNFVHLHNHTDASVQDALPSAYQLAQQAREMGFTACGITEHGNMNSSFQFMDGCTKPLQDLPPIKPIVGMEAYTCENRHVKENVRVTADGNSTKGRPKHPH